MTVRYYGDDIRPAVVFHFYCISFAAYFNKLCMYLKMKKAQGFIILTGQKVHCPEITTLTLQFKDWSLLLIETKLCGPWKNTGQ